MAFIITEEIIEKASTYIPLATKAALAMELAKDCVMRSAVAVVNDDGETEALPPRYVENVMRREQYKMGVFAHYYLHCHDGSESLLMPLDKYDEWQGEQIFCQIEKMKKHAQLKDKVFEILNDFKAFMSMLKTEIYSEVNTRNDGVARALSLIYAQLTPAALEAAQARLNEMAGEANE